MYNELAESSPENVVKAPRGSKFTRTGEDFYLTTLGVRTKLNIPKKSFALKYKDEVWYAGLSDDIIIFKTNGETWRKVSGDGKKGWVKISDKTTTVTVPFVPFEPILGDIEYLAAGYNSSYFIKTDNSLWACGENSNGQLGIGNTEEKFTSSYVMSDVSKIVSSCEGYHAVALKTNGTLWMAGNNSSGQFGNGTYDDTNVFVQVDISGSITGSSVISEIGTGENYTAILMGDGTLWYAGNEWNDTSAGWVQLDSSVKNISGGGYHLLYVKNDDTLWGVGSNNDGQLGLGSTSYENSPVQIDTGVYKAFAGGYHSAYIKTDNSLWMMGANWDGQCARSSNTVDNALSPIQVDTNVSHASLGDSHTLYIKSDKTLYGVGADWSGQLGLTGNYDSVFSPSEIDTDVAMVIAGGEHTLYKKTNKLSYGSGYNYYFQLGKLPSLAINSNNEWSGIYSVNGIEENLHLYEWDNSIYYNGTFVVGGRSDSGVVCIIYSQDGQTWQTGSLPGVYGGAVGKFVSDGTKIVAAGVGGNSLISSDGINWVTGSLTYGSAYDAAYGSGSFIITQNNGYLYKSTDGISWSYLAQSSGSNPAICYAEDKFTVISRTSGAEVYYSFSQSFNGNTVDGFSLADSSAAFGGTQYIIKNGILYGIGNGYSGQLGTSIKTYTYDYIQIASDVKSVSATYDGCLFIKNDNTLWGMGDNYHGIYGDTGRNYVYSPIQIDTDVSQSYSGQFDTLYIKNDNTLWGLGRNYNQALSSSLQSNFATPTYIDSNVVSAGAGFNFILYVKSDNTLWGRGDNMYGQLGTGDQVKRTSSIQIDTDVIYCTAGGGTSFYIKNDNTLLGMGYNGGKLGPYPLFDPYAVVTPSYITSSVKSVSVDPLNTLLIKTNGDLYGMGNNGGALGLGADSGSIIDSPTYIMSGVKNIHCGGGYGGGRSIIQKTDNTVWVAGVNRGGELGFIPINKSNFYSNDAITWTQFDSPKVAQSNNIEYGNGKFVHISHGNISMHSDDGINWNNGNYNTSGYCQVSSLIFDGEKFAAVDYYTETLGSNFYTSTDGVSWTKSKIGQDNYWNSIVYGNGKYVISSEYPIDYQTNFKKLEIS